MIRVDPSYEVVLTYSPIPEITGHLFECFDYWLHLRLRFKTGILLLGALPMEQLQIAWESKYVVPFSEVEPCIQIVPWAELDRKKSKLVVFGSKTVVLLVDGNIQSLSYWSIVFSTKKLFGFLCEYDRFHEVKTNRHISFLMDSRVYGAPLKSFRSIDYVKKIPFQHYKKAPLVDPRLGMAYMTFACRLVTPQVVLDYLEASGCEKLMLVVPEKKPDFDGLPGVEQTTAPVQDFFSKFGTYVYLPVARHFDCSPRLVAECFFHQKRFFEQNGYADPGFDVRLRDCREDFHSIWLTDRSDDIDYVIAEALAAN